MANITLLKKLRNRFLRMKHPKHFRMRQIAVKTECGAAMCFIGHILELEGYKRYLLPPGLRSTSKMDPNQLDYEFVSPLGIKLYSEDLFSTAEDLTDLPYQVTGKLFMDLSIKTPKQAANRIQKIIDEFKL